ncbi:hypothetical protein GCM10007878_23110 [Marinospirillum insulare]|uniref:Uncharacterized protein n=1 Tax=Marinospirillum insulare TaxID=217169 RepID=A0ABQ6A0I6_9GAMM|nr:hypothetical protein GCM10007878_23110 [Marinospirillum insulare]
MDYSLGLNLNREMIEGIIALLGLNLHLTDALIVTLVYPKPQIFFWIKFHLTLSHGLIKEINDVRANY